ncbi:hypothetical protein CLV98_105110 [Dyadobacter jejuensis]|uniref:Fibronectin type 3 domain-containing protein n=1 Tax=Dyadobacter jejuensis TaxID=1082580 RepID=A0A316AMA7_9BACT|nr:hypothetical protein [Dyadobacter jejuensis]PWJ57930.1 hypothetical protein CLV98_105110 [Dyadobacter jejuensis]
MKHFSPKSFYLLMLVIFVFHKNGFSQIALLGDNAPFANKLDGDFNAVWASWRAAKQSPYWTTRVVKGNEPMGVHEGALFSMNELGVAESMRLSGTADYPEPRVGDVWNWSFGADLEYISKGTISLSLVFADHEQLLAEKVALHGSDKVIEHFSGTYTLTAQDVKMGFPFVRATFYSGEGIKVFLDYVNINVATPELPAPVLRGEASKEGVLLQWEDNLAATATSYAIYRSTSEREGYQKIGACAAQSFLDTTIVNGINYTYVLTKSARESSRSNKVNIRRLDRDAPAPPQDLAVQVYDTEIKLMWSKSVDKDVSHYAVYRTDARGGNAVEIAHHLKHNSYLDFTPEKGVENIYTVYAYDYSGNKSAASPSIKSKVKAVFGASFSDLILPMPIHKGLRSDVWGAPGVVPRDPDNGIEDKDWSYWGGRPVEDPDGQYHMLVTRWPANATKGHWEWPNSTVAHAVAKKPTGPYLVKDTLAYEAHQGYGHNPDIILLNDGTFMLYSLINWEPTLFTSKSMNGPWSRLGVITIDTLNLRDNPSLFYRYQRNLSGVHLDDGRFLFVTKAGAMMISQGVDPLGPYRVLTKALEGSWVIPEKYRNSNYEDPVIWKDDVQFHMIINAFLDYRAIYLRSPDGIHWKFNPGTAYTPNNTRYQDGTQTHWYKLERPHVLQDGLGRATHLSLAVIDVPKADDLARDNHSSKNIVIPLTVPKQIRLLTKEPINKKINIKLLIKSEKGFDAQNDIDLNSLRFGASEEVDFGNGMVMVKAKKRGKDLLVVFGKEGHGLTEKDFTGKLLGFTKEHQLILRYVKLMSNLKYEE